MKRKVFYIEDEPFLGKIVKDTLETQGFEVLWETDGAKVMTHFEVFKPEICVLDIMLPNIDGYTLCRQIRSLFPKNAGHLFNRQSRNKRSGSRI